MKKLFCGFIFLWLSFLVLNAQEYKFEGYLLSKDKKSKINYELLFNLKNNNIEGFSISGKGTNDETKAEVKGSLKADSTFIIKELNVISSKQKSKDYCLLILNGNITSNQYEVGIDGDFNGYLNGNLNKKIIDGTLHFSNIKNPNREQFVKDSIATAILLKKEEVRKYQEVLDFINENTNELIFRTSSNKVYVTIDDYCDEDGDIVTLKNKEHIILSNYNLSKEEHSIEIITIENPTILIQAINAGAISPATIKVKLNDGKSEKEKTFDLSIGQQATLYIYKTD